jgi:hypothetical protein
MEGRHAVELASRKFRIQVDSIKGGYVDISTHGDDLITDWHNHDYRIHPDDLQAWHDSQKRDVWTYSSSITGEGIGRVQLYRNGKGFYLFESITYEALDELLAALNGEPAPVTAQDYRPWTNRDVQAGTVLVCSGTKESSIVTRVWKTAVQVECCDFTFEAILHSNWRQLNGDRCGIRIRKGGA